MEALEKLDSQTYDRLFVTSDTHFNHNKEFLFAKRGYEDPRSMTDDMIQIINQTVGENGILLHLGDFCLNSTQEDVKYIMSRLRINSLWLLWGNHNNPIFKIFQGVTLQTCQWNSELTIRCLGHYYTFRRGSKEFVCFHFPLQIWDAINNGSMHLCGHSHGSNVRSLPQTKEGKILDCGWDVHRKPLAMKEIEYIMNSKEITPTHHAVVGN